MPQGLNVPELKIRARNIPYREVGGDFFDFVRLDADRIGVLIGDVSGKGVPAALLMVKILTDFRTGCVVQTDICRNY